MKEYKVIQVKKKGLLTGPLSAEQLQKILNEQGCLGWVFDKVIGSETLVMGRDTFLLIFYKDVTNKE